MLRSLNSSFFIQKLNKNNFDFWHTMAHCAPPQKQFLTQRVGKDTGFKRIILVAVSKDLPEAHSNIDQIW